MKEKSTDYGRLIVGTKEELFAKAVELTAQQAKKTSAPCFSWAFTGGSTPLEWYRWCVEKKAIPTDLVTRTDFTVSDERYVPLTSDQSNFGHADRGLLTPLKVADAQRVPWPVALPPHEAAAAYSRTWSGRFGAGRAYDVCFLGMGDDAHTASMFPGTPLISNEPKEFFVAVEVPGKGWRLTITAEGLRACGLIVVMTLGANKAPALAKVMKGPYEPIHAPSQILKTCAKNVVWLVDEAAAAQV